MLSLNGLRTGDKCPGTLEIPLTGVTLNNKIGGTIPPCVWGMRNLSVLHLTGNGLTGELPQELIVSPTITDISLSYNELRGAISPGLLSVNNLDVSVNKFSGEISHEANFLQNANVTFEINRLSGHLPMREMQNISRQIGKLNVLRGNMFSCNSIPDNDDYSQDYICGSQNLNTSLLALAASILVIISLLCAICTSQHCLCSWANIVRTDGHHLLRYLNYVDGMTKFCNDSNSPVLYQIIIFGKSWMNVIRYNFQLISIVMLGSAICYLLKVLQDNEDYTTHSNTYSWFWTFAFTSGLTPAIMVLTLWIGTMTTFFYFIVSPWRLDKGVNTSQQKDNQSDMICKDDNTPPMMTVMAYVCANFITTVTVNTFYIYSTQQALGSFIQFAIQLGLSVFRLAYIAFIVPMISMPILDPIHNIRFRVTLFMFNNLLIPCVVTALTSKACFQVTQ